MANAQSILSMIKAKDIKFVDLRFTDPRGKWQHVTYDLSLVEGSVTTAHDVERIQEVRPWFSGEMLVLLRDGTRLKLSRNYRKKLEELQRLPT